MTNHHRRPRRERRGFTLIEAIVVVVIIAVLATVVAPNILKRIGQSKRSTAEASVASLLVALRGYLADHGPPPSGAGIEILWERPSAVPEDKWKNSAAPYVESPDAFTDPWGNKYALQMPGPDGKEFVIISYGADGKPGGEGESQDIVKP